MGELLKGKVVNVGSGGERATTASIGLPIASDQKIQVSDNYK